MQDFSEHGKFGSGSKRVSALITGLANRLITGNEKEWRPLGGLWVDFLEMPWREAWWAPGAWVGLTGPLGEVCDIVEGPRWG